LQEYYCVSSSLKKERRIKRHLDFAGQIEFYSQIVSLFVSFDENPVEGEVMFQIDKNPK